jgi:hypothetical protein
MTALLNTLHLRGFGISKWRYHIGVRIYSSEASKQRLNKRTKRRKVYS